MNSPHKHSAIIPVRPAVIYTLTNPINGKIFYVGSTRGRLKATLKRHMSKVAIPQTPKKRAVIRAIVKKGKEPIITVIENCTVDNQFAREKYWRHRLAKRHSLTNACGIIK